MADPAETQSLFLQVDASIELLRRNLASGEQPLQRFEQRAAKMAANVDASIEGMGKRFGSFAQLAETAAQRAERSFNDSFSAIQKMAAAAIQSPASSTGAVNVGAADARAAADMAQQRATALGLIEQAARRAAAGEGQLTAETRLYLQAASAARIEAERHAQELNREAAALERVEIELKQAGAGHQLLAAQQRNATAISNQQRTSTMMLGQQVQDFAVQVSNGGSVTTAFSQQIGQAAFAVQGMGGKMAGVASFLMSGWGAAVLVALTVLTPLVGKLLEGNNALEDAVDKLKKDAAETEINRQAKELFRHTQEGVAAAIRDGTEATKKAIEAERTAAEQANIAAKRNLEEEVSIRRKTQARLEDAKALLAEQIRRATGPGGEKSDLAALGIGRAQERVTTIEGQIAAQTKLIQEAERRVQETRIGLAEETAKRMADPIARINKLYDDQVDAAKKAAREQIAAGRQVTSALTAQLAEIERKRKAAVEAEQKRQSAANRIVSPGAAVRSAQGDALFSSADRFRGQGEGSADVIGLLRRAGISVDPKMVAWCAAFVNAVLSTNGLPGTGSLAARSFLNYGTSTDSPVRGDIVVSRRGNNPAQGHVGFYQGRDERGNVLVLGGNTKDRVGVQRVAPGDVLGFRRAPTASAIEKTQARTAESALADAIAYSEQERQARRRLVDAQLRTAETEEKRDQLLRDDINAEADAQKTKINAQRAKGDIDEAQEKHLLAINEATREQRLQNVKIAAARRTIERKYAAEEDSLEAQIAIARIELDMATTTQERKRLALRLLALEQELERKRLEEIRDTSDDPDAVQSAKDALARLPERQGKERDREAERYKSPMEDYRDRLKAATGDMDEALERVQVNALQGLEDGLVGIITGTESVGAAFKRMAASIIADLARIAIQKLIVNAIGGSFLGLAGGGKVEGKAGGGLIRGPGSGTSDSILGLVGGLKPIMLSNGESIVTADATAKYWPIIDAMNQGKFPKFAKGGLVTPRLPQMSGAGIGGRTVHEHHWHVNAQGAILASGIIAELQSVGVRATLGGAELAQRQLTEQSSATLA